MQEKSFKQPKTKPYYEKKVPLKWTVFDKSPMNLFSALSFWHHLINGIYFGFPLSLFLDVIKRCISWLIWSNFIKSILVLLRLSLFNEQKMTISNSRPTLFYLLWMRKVLLWLCIQNGEIHPFRSIPRHVSSIRARFCSLARRQKGFKNTLWKEIGVVLFSSECFDTNIRPGAHANRQKSNFAGHACIRITVLSMAVATTTTTTMLVTILSLLSMVRVFHQAIRCRYSTGWFIALLLNNTMDIQKGSHTWEVICVVTMCVYTVHSW